MFHVVILTKFMLVSESKRISWNLPFSFPKQETHFKMSPPSAFTSISSNSEICGESTLEVLRAKTDEMFSCEFYRQVKQENLIPSG